MMNCPLCGNAAHTRSSFQVSATTKERYNQCQNINCSCTFKSHETVSEIIMKQVALNLCRRIREETSSNHCGFDC